MTPIYQDHIFWQCKLLAFENIIKGLYFFSSNSSIILHMAISNIYLVLLFVEHLNVIIRIHPPRLDSNIDRPRLIPWGSNSFTSTQICVQSFFASSKATIRAVPNDKKKKQVRNLLMRQKVLLWSSPKTLINKLVYWIFSL